MTNKNVKRKFIISEKAWNTMQQYARIAYNKDKNEVSGITCVRKVEHPESKERVWELFNPVILKQENTGTTTELDSDALRDFYVKAAMKYGEDIRFCWWHSHHTMGAFWSGTDVNEIKEWKNDSWSLALVINLFQEYLLNVSTWDPIEHSEDVPLEILRNIPAPTKIQEKEYDELCEKPTTIITNYTNKRDWTHNYKQTNQVGIWTSPKDIVPDDSDPLASDEKLKWAKHDNAVPYAELFNHVVEEIDEMMTDFAAGEKDYKEYSDFIIQINARLDARNAKIKVKKVAKGKLLEKTSTLWPADHIKYDNDQVENAYQNAVTTIDRIMGGGYEYY